MTRSPACAGGEFRRLVSGGECVGAAQCRGDTLSGPGLSERHEIMIGVTPEEHAARAAELVADAERLYQICLVDYETNINDDDYSEEPYVPGADLAMLTATTPLAQAHAALARLPSTGD